MTSLAVLATVTNTKHVAEEAASWLKKLTTCLVAQYSTDNMLIRIKKLTFLLKALNDFRIQNVAYYPRGQLETVETETGNGKWKWKTETIKLDANEC